MKECTAGERLRQGWNRGGTGQVKFAERRRYILPQREAGDGSMTFFRKPACAPARRDRLITIGTPSVIALSHDAGRGRGHRCDDPECTVVSIDPATCLALFIAPAVVDAAFDFPPGATRRFVAPLVTYAVIAVVLTTAVVAWIAWAFLGLPLAAGIALGAVVSPPDAAAATASEKILSSSPNRCRAERRESVQ